MLTSMDVFYIFAAFTSSVLLFFGIKLNRTNYIIACLWLSIIALFVNYRTFGGEILGGYFDYLHAAIYSWNLIVLIASIIRLLLTSWHQENKFLFYSARLLSAFLIGGMLLLLINLGVNATFIDDRLPGTSLLQVAILNELPYCNYKYIFYKVGPKNTISYLCPNRYGLLPSTGTLHTVSKPLLKQLLTNS